MPIWTPVTEAGAPTCGSGLKMRRCMYPVGVSSIRTLTKKFVPATTCEQNDCGVHCAGIPFQPVAWARATAASFSPIQRAATSSVRPERL